MEPNCINFLAKWLADLNSENFKDAIGNVEEKLAIFNQTLSLLDNLLESQNFDPILNELFRSLSFKTKELLEADRTTFWLLDRDRDEFWSIVPLEKGNRPIEIRIPVGVGIIGQAATSKQAVNILDCYNDRSILESARFFYKLRAAGQKSDSM
ncbi:MAG: GAF domain-containing protein [Cyanobacteriota bacterium]|nr:GAF domain-containing protein [Cyanobacteriota bacterium]